MPYVELEVRRRYQREWLARRRAEWLGDKTCVICGSTDRLEVDHVNRANKVTHRIWSWSQARRDAELAKCQVLCHKHHREKSTNELLRPHLHGTLSEWRRGCRCDSCRKVKVDYYREWRKKRREAGLAAP